jgi:tetraacyldisaccharide 4'-kinase
LLDLLYSRLARARRRYYQHRPHLRRRLAAPVISIGNLTLGGSSKTPLAAEIARTLVAMGERPAILSRGYARRIFSEGVVIVSDGIRVLEPVERSGDEPQMLANAVPNAAVLVSPSRYLAGRIAESRLGCTVHVLDDGFQHFDLMRDIDLLVLPDTLDDPRTLPFGRFREPLDAASAADALLVEDRAKALCHQTTEKDTAEALCHQTSEKDRAEGLWQSAVAQGFSPVLPQPTFTFTRRLRGPAPDRRAFAFAGIARPERFFSDLEHAGWTLTGRRAFADHHHYSTAEIERLVQAAESSAAEVILTTEKDYVRLASVVDRPSSIVAVQLEVTIDSAFQPWLADRLHRARAGAA